MWAVFFFSPAFTSVPVQNDRREAQTDLYSSAVGMQVNRILINCIGNKSHL